MMLQLNTLFSDGMVLQGGQEIPVWGKSDGDHVEVSIHGIRISAPVRDGAFSLKLPALEYGTGFTLTVEGNETVTVKDVAVGDVWFCGGQSNMEFQMYFDKGFEQEAVSLGDIRYFGIPEIADPEALERFDYSDWNFWRKNQTKESLKFYSALGYYFGKELARETGHSIGLINCSWGATAALPWLDPAEIKDTPGRLWIDEYEKGLSGRTEEECREEYLSNPMSGRGRQFDDPVSCRLLQGMSHLEQMEILSGMPSAPAKSGLPYFDTPGILFRQMVLQAAPYGIKGFLWYQGEAETDPVHAGLYGYMLTGVINSWRKAWKSRIPFYVVQLPSFGQWLGFNGDEFPTVRTLQEQVADTMEQVYLVSTMDCGMLWDVHPKRKQQIGIRLAKLALKNSYGREILAGSPRPIRVESENGRVILYFDHAEGGLVWREELEGSHAMRVVINEVPVEDFWWETRDDSIVIACGQFSPGTNIRIDFACRGYDPVNVYNQAGFSVRPFSVTLDM